MRYDRPEYIKSEPVVVQINIFSISKLNKHQWMPTFFFEEKSRSYRKVFF